MRRLVEIFPPKLRKVWNDLELQVLVLLSLFLQIVLISTGNRRKYTRRKWVAVILWLSYLSADAVATISLGVLSQAQSDEKSLVDPSYAIMAFWAPFLLMHLGGPDSITAYALADNELWSRHFLGLVSQVGVAVYVFLRSWIGTPINYLWIVVFVAGLVKYGERTWVLFSASRDQFRESMVSRPDPGPNYAKFMEELVSKELEGYKVSLGNAIDDQLRESMASHPDPGPNYPNFKDDQLVFKDLKGCNASLASTVEGIQDASVLQEAYSFFGTFKKLFADLILSFQDKETTVSFFKTLSWEKAFSIIEIELGLIYDLFYTKAFILYSPHGFFLRVLSFSSTMAAFAAFLIIDKNDYSKTEVIITYVLLVGAIFLEIYAIMILLSSDRMMIWLSGDWITLPKLIRKFKIPIVFTICKIVSLLRYLHVVPATMRWSNEMGQYNVLKCCLENKPKCIKVHKYLEKVHQYLEKYLFWNSASVPKGLKALIFDELKKRVDTDDKKLGSYRGDKILLKEMNYYDKDDKYEVEFDQSVLLWHMATDFCYHTDVDEDEVPGKTWLHEFIVNEESALEDNLKFKREICRLLSNYMMHLLIMSPFMLPSGIGQIRFQDTCAEATEFFEEQKLIKRCACEMLHQVDTRLPPSQVKGDRSKSLLFDACRLVKCLESPTVGEQKWEKITQAWLDILTFAAAQCRWNDHAEKLSQGGELLTHVWLLMAHFGMTDQFQISQGHVRAKLNLK